MSDRRWRSVWRSALAAGLGCVLSTAAHGAATIRVINRDGPGEGFNDPTAVAPVGGNTGTTIGEQRLIAFQYAADLWAAQLDSPVEIRVSATFDPLDCNATGVTLGQASPVSVFSDFAGAPRPATWYPAALADKLAGMDLAPDEDDIEAQFNSVFGTTCAFPAGFYYGLDANPVGDDSDFVTVVLHELAHGLGFLTLIDVQTGERMRTNNGTPQDDALMQFLYDARNGFLFTEMSNAQRASASRATQQLMWEGPNVSAASDVVTVGVDPSGRVEMYAPNPPQVGSSVSHWSDEVRPVQLLAPYFVTAIHDVGLTLPALADLGWARAAAGCAADCNGDGVVTINELIVAVSIALGEATVDACLAVDANGSGQVEVNELVAAVSSALGGCPGGAPTPTPTDSQTPEPTATATAPPPTQCPLDFSNDTSAQNLLCIYAGRWNAACGGDALEVSFGSTGQDLLVVIGGNPLIGLAANVTSPTSATLQGWFTDFTSFSDFQPLAGSVTLTDSGAGLHIDVDQAGFAVDACDFAAYVGAFTGVASGG